MTQIKLVSNDDKCFTVDSEIITRCMKTIENLFDGLGKFEPEEAIAIPANGEILQKILDWIIHHKGDPPEYYEVWNITKWDQQFLEDNGEILLDIIEAAKYLEMHSLLQLYYVHTWR